MERKIGEVFKFNDVVKLKVIENFNATYSNTRLSFDEAKCAFVIEDIDVDDNLPTEEEITQQTENNNENK